jgi:hypothetical protein
MSCLHAALVGDEPAAAGGQWAVAPEARQGEVEYEITRSAWQQRHRRA